MTADPIAPGRGLPVYQPATVVVPGTWSVPFRCRPRWRSEVFTPMAGMVSDTGAAGRAVVCSPTGLAVGPEGVTTGVGGAGRGADVTVVPPATPSPTAPAATASTPAPSIEAASSRPREVTARRCAVHRLIVVARTRAQEGSAEAGCTAGVASGGTAAGPGGCTVLADGSGSGARGLTTRSLRPAVTVSQRGSHQSASQAGSHQSS